MALSALSKPLGISLLLSLAVIISLALTPLYVLIVHGRAVHSHVIHHKRPILTDSGFDVGIDRARQQVKERDQEKENAACA
jgi:hypothetical protein